MLRVTLRGILAHKVRLVATALAVLLGVAFMTGTQVLTSSIGAAFDKVFADVYAPIDVVVRSSTEIDTPFGSERARVDAEVIPTVAGVEGVEAAEGQVVAQIRVLDRAGDPLVPSQGPPNFGLNWLTEPSLNGWTLAEGTAPTGPDDIVLDAKTAADGAYSVGDPVSVAVTGGVRGFTVVGVARFGQVDTWGGAQAALFETSTLQDLVGEPDRFDWISVAGDGPSQAELTRRVAQVLPPDTEAVTGEDFTEESQDAFQRLISVFNTFLLTFALIALFVGSFIIYNTFSVIVAGRTRELALLRAVGASRGQVLRSVLVEAAVVGLVASAVGVVAGIGLAIGLNSLLRSIGFAGPETRLLVPAAAVVSSVLVGTAITLLAAVLPARRAATIAPVAAMNDLGAESERTSRRRVVAGLVLLAVGALVAYEGLFRREGGDLRVLGLGALGVFLGAAVLGPVTAPVMARAIGRPLPRLRGVDGRLAVENAVRSPRRTATTASALMIGVGLVAFIAIAAQSVRESTSAAIDAAVLGQFVVTSDGFGATALPPEVVDGIRSVPGVAAAAGLRATFASVDGDGRLVLAADPTQITQLVDFQDVEGTLADLDDAGVAVSEDLASDRGLAVGDTVPVTFPGGASTDLVVESVYDTRLPLRGPGWLITQDLFDRNVPPDLQTDRVVYVKLDDGSDAGVEAARLDLERIVDAVPGAEVQDIGEFQEAQGARADQFLLIVYVLLALALVIAVVGVVNTLLLSVHERTRELGLLRAVGMSRRQVRSSIRWESVIISLIGTATGMVIGLAFGWAVVRALRDDGITAFAIPWTQLAAVVVLAALAGVGAALYPAWRASRLDVLAAIATE